MSKRVVLTSSRFELAHHRARSMADTGPGHTVDDLASAIGAVVVQPGDGEPRVTHRLFGRMFATSAHWASATLALRTVGSDGLVVAIGEEAGLPAAAANAVRHRARVAVSVVSPRRPRVRAMLFVLRLVGRLPWLLTNTVDKARFMEHWLRLQPGTVHVVPDQTDERFFRPDPDQRRGSHRPLIVSCGMEQRDYETLARATRDLAVDVKVCAVSPNLTARTRHRMPDVVPDNMELGYFDFPALRELYRAADVTVITLLDNRHSAGSTAVLEAIACGSPVIVTRTEGLAEQLIALDAVVGVPPADPEALRAALLGVIDDPHTALVRAQRARDYVLDHHTSAEHVTQLARILAEGEGRTG